MMQILYNSIVIIIQNLYMFYYHINDINDKNYEHIEFKNSTYTHVINNILITFIKLKKNKDMYYFIIYKFINNNRIL
jgi:hypothetical protein